MSSVIFRAGFTINLTDLQINVTLLKNRWFIDRQVVRAFKTHQDRTFTTAISFKVAF